MADAPNPGALDAIPPALRYRLRAALAAPTDERLARVLADGEPWLGCEPALADVGYWLLDGKQPLELRVRACAWLTLFPSVETAKRLAAVALDAATPGPVREAAISALGARQVRAAHASLLWPDDAVQIADEALVRLADSATAAGKIASERLPHALRHVQGDGIAAVFARAPGLWGDALECFATPPLARVLFVSLDDIPAQHRLRALRLVGATLGEEAVPLLVARASRAPIAERIEMLFLAVALGGEVHLPRLDEVIRALPRADQLRARAKWHLAHRGAVPTVTGLRVARATAVLPVAERLKRCVQAADDLAALARFERHAEPYLYALWGWCVRGSQDPVRARELVAAHPASQALVRDLYIEDLARRGRVAQLAALARAHGGADLGALALAVWGRPLAALELATAARTHSPELVCARALACYRAGRPDLTARLVAEDLPPAEIVDDGPHAPFPGPHEQWTSERVHVAPGTAPAIAANAAAIRGLAHGVAGVVALARPAPHDAEPDLASLAPIQSVVQRLGRGLAGATVYVAGELKREERAKLVAAVERVGARLVTGPGPGTDYYVLGDGAPAHAIAQLERHGARRSPALEAERR